MNDETKAEDFGIFESRYIWHKTNTAFHFLKNKKLKHHRVKHGGGDGLLLLDLDLDK